MNRREPAWRLRFAKNGFRWKLKQTSTDANGRENQRSTGWNRDVEAENREGRNASCPVGGERSMVDVDRA
jgi:hypothetical protein